MIIILFNTFLLIGSLQISYIHCGDDSSSFNELQVENGRIRGTVENTIYRGHTFYAFRGIPYAKPPLKDLRFLPPKKIDKWNDVLNTTVFKSVCVQIKPGSKIVEGNEDCLYLNVYIPDGAINDRATIFYIHGGSFTSGEGNDNILGPDFLIEKDVILVTVQYRLSPFGFMSLGTTKYSGNMGLKDVGLALEWTHDNIHNFGGDREKITVVGHSAGGILAHLTAFFAPTRNLFQRMILQSGATLNIAVDFYQNHRELMMEIARKNGQTIQNDDELIEYLNNIDPYELYRETYYDFVNHLPEQRITNLIFYPIFENNDAEEPFLNDFPECLIKHNKHNLSVLTGFTTKEYLASAGVNTLKPNYLKPFDENFEIEFPNRDFKLDFNSSEYRVMASKVREMYFGQSTIDNTTFYEYVDLLSDIILFNYRIYKTVQGNVENYNGPTFYYRLSIDGGLNLFKKARRMDHFNGTAHGDELCYIFKCKYLGGLYNYLNEFSLERQIIERMTTLWTNFAKYGDPTPNNVPVEWKPAVLKNHSIQNLMDISNDGLHLIENPNFKTYEFWDKLFEDYEHFRKPMNNITYN